ncbi:hypothetical protein [Dethiosulfatarculus sandiegensis]|uniref:Uncharacterized protein n=1 Tax=Dethiosulfatarculus sandiegensis TaxID=1429043 RepID=A0A0D2I0T1_9BACT|nr:hypothetical protein [Dethiosulfatarculus sandiegensis]KIX16083.1 hypothetical protein X474_01000 [Dethiosulfatarculus sandiegensis]
MVLGAPSKKIKFDLRRFLGNDSAETHFLSLFNQGEEKVWKKIITELALAALLAMRAPVLAAEALAPSVILGARVNQTIGWQNESHELTNNGQDDATKSFVDLPGNSYFRGKFTSADKKVGVHVGIDLKSNVARRPVYGWYKVGNCKLLAGNTDNWHGAPYWNYQKLNAAPGGGLLGWVKLWPHVAPGSADL